MTNDRRPPFGAPGPELDAWYRRTPEEIEAERAGRAYRAWRSLSSVGASEDELSGGEGQDDLLGGAGRDRLKAPAKPPPKPLPAVGPGARKLLDLFARAEGTAGDVRAQKGYASDYDVVFGYGAAEPPGRRKALSQMTLDEGRELQRRMKGSSAIGRYQIMPGTMKGLRERHGLTGAEIMDGALQDGLARSLMVEKGYDAYCRGAKSADEVLDGFAAIWASLPQADGASRYSYNGKPQPVGTSRAELRATLDEACRLDFGRPPPAKR